MRTQFISLKAWFLILCTAFAACTTPLLQAQQTYEGAGDEMLNPVGYVQIGAPSSLAGGSLFMQITNGTYPFPSSGYALMVADTSTNTYRTIGIYNVQNSSGTYSTTNTDAFTAQVTLNDAADSLAEQLTLSFDTTSQGSFSNVTTDPAGSESGMFAFAQGSAPSGIGGKVLNCVITDGLSPLASSGVFTLTPTISSNTYTITGGEGVGDSTGTYSYTLLNQSTAVVQKEDSVSGSITAYFTYMSATNGIFAVSQQSTGAYQFGTFTMAANPPAAFFGDESSLGGGWYYLSEGSDHAFGYYSMALFPFVYHLDMSWEYVIDADNSNRGAYFYDYTDNVFFYTEPNLFPYIFDFNRNAWLYYLPVTNIPDRYTTGPRWFFDFTTHAWVTHL